MEKKSFKNQFIIGIIILAFCFACTPIDHYYEAYILGADKIYPGKVDSVKILSGYNRAIISSLLSSDPKVVKLKIYWQNKQDSIELAISISDIGKRKDVEINPITEGTYNFELVTFDAKNNLSVKTEVFGRIYGDTYIKNLNNRIVSSSGINSSSIAFVKWIQENSVNLIGTKLNYTDQNDKSISIIVPKNELSTILPNYKLGSAIEYRAMFLPVATAIDTFYTAEKTLIIN